MSIIFKSLLFLYILHNISCVSVQVKAWIQKGYYYSHRCEVTFQITSDYFQQPFQIFHIITKQNSNFFHTQNSLNPAYAIGHNHIQMRFNPNQQRCKYLTSTNYFCTLIYTNVPNTYNITFYHPFNSTHRKMYFRIPRVICPTEQLSNKMIFQVKMPQQKDYDLYYFNIPTSEMSYYNQTKSNNGILTFVYNKQVTVDTRNLQYKQLPERNILLPQPVNYLINCKFKYTTALKFQNISYYNTFDQIQLIISNPSIIQLSDQCISTYLKSFTCTKTFTGYKFINLNQSNDLIKSYEITDFQYYQYQPMLFNIQFVGVFKQIGEIQVEVIIRANNNQIRENWLNITHSLYVNNQIYGRKVQKIYAVEESVFQKIQIYSTKLDPLKCITPYVSPNSSINSTTTNNTTTNTTTTTNYTTIPQIEPFTFTQPSTSKTGLLFIPLLILILLLTLYFCTEIYKFQKILYLILIFTLSLLKLIYLSIGIDPTYLTDPSLPNDSILLRKQKDSLELFVIKYTFILQIVLNGLYFFMYGVMWMFSEEVIKKIKKFYGTAFYKIKQNKENNLNQQVKIKKCNLSTFIFAFTTLVMFLLSYKFYALFIYKMHLNNNDEKVFKKYRFKNIFLYKIHQGHLSIDIFLSLNLISWVYLLSQYCQNPKFDIFLYILLGLYCLQLYLMVLVFKSFYIMSKISNQLNQTENNKIKSQCELMNQEDCFTEDNQMGKEQLMEDKIRGKL